MKYAVVFPVEHADDSGVSTSYLPIGEADTLEETRAVIQQAQAEDMARIAAGTLDTGTGQPWGYAVLDARGKEVEI